MRAVLSKMLADAASVKDFWDTTFSLILISHVCMIERVFHWKWAMHNAESFVPCGCAFLSCGNKMVSRAWSIGCYIYARCLGLFSWAMLPIAILASFLFICTFRRCCLNNL